MRFSLVWGVVVLIAVPTAASALDLDAVRMTAVADADYRPAGEAEVDLGRLLFFDKILSGNRNISCATCHHPDHASSDAVALSLGEGPAGLGPERAAGDTPSTSVHERVPRNSPALFNVGAREFTRLFHDGRVEADTSGHYVGGFITPAKWKLPEGLSSVLAAQALFPVTSSTEMAGQQGENDVADAVALNRSAGPGGAWDLIADRLRAIPEYVEAFRRAYPNSISDAEDLSMVHVANAIAAFETVAFRSDQSPFDAFLRGDDDALSPAARRGLDLFVGKADCASCHSGPFLTDHEFHAIAMPQIGPGKGDGRGSGYWRESGHETFLEDFGRGRVTMRVDDEFKFRTPSLRNVARTGPWGHAGAYDSLEDVVRHHLSPIDALNAYDRDVDLPLLAGIVELAADGSELRQEWLSDARFDGFMLRDDWVQSSPSLRRRIAEANELSPVELSDDEVDDLVEFLESLTDPSVDGLDVWVPASVPSGLPVPD